MNNIEVKTISITAYVTKDVREGVFTVFMEGKGGPIISAPTEEEAKIKFEEALNLSCAVKNLLTYNDAVKAQEAEMKKFADSSSPKEVEIDFIDIPSPQYAD